MSVTDVQGQAPDDDTPPVGTPNDPAPDTGADDDANGQVPDGDAEALKAELARVRREAAGYRRKARDLEAAEQARADAELSEAERANKRAAELEAELAKRDARIREAALRESVSNAANRLGIVDPDAASRLIDHASLEYDDESGRWSGVDEALAALVRERPWLVATGRDGGQGNGNPSNPPRRRTSLTIADLKGMTPAEVAEIPREELHRILSGK